MKVRGTKYVWTQRTSYTTLYYARKDWATCVMDQHKGGGGPKFIQPTPTPFGTFHHDKQREVLFLVTHRKGWHYWRMAPW